MDWNWFFSSLAQSSAAIVGVVAAFVISKIINNQSNFDRSKNRLRYLLSQSERFVHQVSITRFEWWSRQMLALTIGRLEEDLARGGTVRSPKEYYVEYDFPIFLKQESVLGKIEKSIAYRAAGEVSHIPGAIKNDVSVASKDLLKAQLDREKQRIDLLLADLGHHVRLVSYHYNYTKDNPESSNGLLILLLGVISLFIIGVIIPLCLTPVNITVTKNINVWMLFSNVLLEMHGILLVPIVVIFVSLLLWLIFVNHGLKYRNEDIVELRKYSELSSYGDALAIMMSNRVSDVSMYDPTAEVQDVLKCDYYFGI